MPETAQEYDIVIGTCSDIFTKKMHDYGMAWRILRPTSITDQVVEHNFYNGNYYGTLREEVDKRLEAGKLVVLVIDVHGAANIRRMFPGATTIFLLPPSVEELERRLRGRGTETEASILERLDTAKKELAEQEKFTLTLVNDEVDACAEKLYGIIRQRAGLDR